MVLRTHRQTVLRGREGGKELTMRRSFLRPLRRVGAFGRFVSIFAMFIGQPDFRSGLLRSQGLQIISVGVINREA